MNSRWAWVTIAAMAFIIAVLSWALIYYARDELRGETGEGDQEQIQTTSGARVEDGRPLVKLSAQSQAAAGVTVQTLKAARSQAAIEVYGAVSNLLPLAESRARYLTGLAEARAARAAVILAEADFRRMDLLFRDDRNVSEQALRSSEARYRGEQARQVVADQAVASLRDAMRGNWGETVTGWATNPDSQMMQALLQHRSFLVQLVLPPDLPRAALRERVVLAPATARERLQSARLVGASPQIDPAFPGDTYFYLVDGGNLRAGTWIIGRVSLSEASVSGVVVPSAAVVWHAGKAWAYVKDDEQTFARHEISTADEMDDGWFNSTGFDANEEVVVSGAQLLLSEELKYQIRNENED